MGVPAFKQFERLSIETETRSEAVAKAGEVLSFALGKAVKVTNQMVESINSLRSVFIEGHVLLDNIKDSELVSEDVIEISAARASVKRLSKRLSYPMLASPKGTSLLSVSEALEGLTLSSSADGRVVRRLVKKVRVSAESCDKQRHRFYVSLTNFTLRLEDTIEKSDLKDEIKQAYVAELRRRAVERHPLINEYLAR